MKTSTSSLVASLAVFLATGLGFLLPAQAVLIKYTGEDVASSPWSRSSLNFTVDSMADSITFGPGAIWAEQLASAPGALWNPDLSNGFVEVSFQIDIGQGGYDTGVAIYTGTREWNILIAEFGVSVNGSTQISTLAIDTTYTLRMDYDATGLDVSLDGNALANLQNVAGSTFGFASVIYLHRYTGSIDAASQATFFEVNFDAVPEPGTAALCVMGGLFGLVFTRHRKCVRSGRGV